MQIWTKPLPVLLTSALALSASAAPAGDGGTAPSVPPLTDGTAQDKTENTVINVFFKEGLRFETADKNFTMKIGTRIAFDSDFINVNNDYEQIFGLEEDGSRFRLARILAEGTYNQNIEWRYSYDFAGGINNKLKDLYIGFQHLCMNGTLRVGQMKEPMGLEQITSITNITFMERGASDVLVPGRNIGAQYLGNCSEERVAWAGGIFRDDGSDTGADTGGHGDYIFTGRVAGTPMMTDPAHLVHVGLSARRRQFRQDAFTLTYSGETTVSKQGDLAEISLGNVDHSDTYGLEAAWVNGPISVQGEYVMQQFDLHNATGLTAEGFYAFVSYFLTGESRPYDKKKAAFSRVHVARPKGINGGLGALEVALRGSRLDLNNQGPTQVAPPNGVFQGGRVASVTAGVNWYLNDFVKVMLDYSWIKPDDNLPGTPTAQVLAMRVQLDI